MNYAILKRQDDHRHTTCGFETPNGKVNVIECTVYNTSQLINLLYLQNYEVEETDAPIGLISAEDYREFFTGEPLDLVRLGLINTPEAAAKAHLPMQ